MKKAIFLTMSCLAGAYVVACSSSTTSGTQGTSSGGGGHATTTLTSSSSTSSSSSGTGGTGGSGSSSSSSSSSSTSSTSSTSSSSSSSSSSSGSAVVNGCDPSTTTVTSGDATITFPSGAAPSQYSPNCVKIHQGAKVTWNGAFASHPLAPEGSNNPITATSTGTTATFTFADEGSFGYHCEFHPSSMLGAIFVVP